MPLDGTKDQRVRKVTLVAIPQGLLVKGEWTLIKLCEHIKDGSFLGFRSCLMTFKGLDPGLEILTSSALSNLLVRSHQIRSVAQSCPTLCDPMNRSTPGLPVHHQLPEFTETHVHRVSDAIQPSHPLSSPSPLAPNPSQHQSLFQWVNSSHEMAKVLEFQL